jgi:hypothetical protein
MTKRIRVQSVRALGAAALVAQVFIFQACGGSNSGTPGTAGTNGGAGTTGTAGTTATAGTTGAAGSTSAAGTTGAGGSTTEHLSCTGLVTAAGVEPTKNGACTPTDPQLCYKTCGPEKTGDKSETCSGGVYVEMSGCAFDPTHDYSCYKIPSAANTACPTGTPQASQACTTDHCVLCNTTGGLPGGHYNDSSGADKIGYCTCQVPNSAGTRTWTCASDTAWPCPAGMGC